MEVADGTDAAHSGRPVNAWYFTIQSSPAFPSQCTPVFAEAAQTASEESVSTNVEPAGQSAEVTILLIEISYAGVTTLVVSSLQPV
jgi:hypothetical protein